IHASPDGHRRSTAAITGKQGGRTAVLPCRAPQRWAPPSRRPHRESCRVPGLMADWAGMFRLETPILELVIRGVVAYLLLLLPIGVAGPREGGRLGISDPLFLVLLAQAVGGSLPGDSESITDAAVLVTTILLCSVVVDAAAYRLSWFSVLTKA